MNSYRPRLKKVNKEWVILYYNDKGVMKRKPLGTHLMSEAQHKFDEWAMDRGGEIHLRALSKQYELEQLDNVKNWRCRELQMRLLNAALGDKHVRDLTSNVINDYVRRRCAGKIAYEGREGRKVKENTVRNEIITLKAIIAHAIKNNRIDSRTVPQIAVPSDAPPKTLTLSRDEVNQFLSCAKWSSPSWVFLLLISQTACRKAAAENLKWSQVDLDRRLIHFGAGEVQSTKRKVTVPMNDLLHFELSQLEREHEYVIPGPARSMTYAFRKTVRLAFDWNANPKFLKCTPHTFRHSWATNAAADGVSPAIIAGVLGDSIATVMKNYVHLNPEHLRSAMG